MNKLLNKLLALLLVIVLVGANLAILGEYTIALALSDDELNKQTSSTNHKNVEFNSYFYGNSHSQTYEVNSEEAKIYLNIKVNNAGYLENGVVELKNTNFKLKDGITNDYIQSIDVKNNKILLNKLNNGSDIVIELPIEILKKESISADYFSKEVTTKFTGTYVDGNGKENEIEKEVVNKIAWKGTAEAELAIEATKYIPYAIEEHYGVMLQTKVNSNVKDNSLPIKNTNLQVTAPTINNMKPTSVTVIATKTEATNGKTNGLDFNNSNYTYDSNTGIVTINVLNNTGDNVSWKDNVADEYLISYIFEGEEIYNFVSKNGINTVVTVNANISVYNNTDTVLTSSQTADIKYTEKAGDITDFAISAPSTISKGHIYANYDADEKAETEYYTKYVATINSAKLINTIKFVQGYDSFVTEENSVGSTTVGSSNYAYNKRVEISQAIFNKILGEDGLITVKDNKGVELGKINKDSTLEDGNYVLNINPGNNNKLSIETSAPITEGQLEINIVKALNGNIDYSKEQMKNFVKMRLELEGNTNTANYKGNAEINLEEPETKVDLEVSKTDLTTVVENKNVEIRATLDTSSEYNALFKNPTLKITLPKAIKEIDLKSSNILLANGLKIKDTKVSEEAGKKVINVELEGTQSEYSLNADYKGAIVVLNTDLTLDTLTPSGNDKITLEYENNNDIATKPEGKLDETVNYVAPTGVVAANGISNYEENADEILSMSDEAQTAEIDAYASERTATMRGIIINNYENDIGNVVVLGRLPAEGNTKIDTSEALGSTFTIPLATQLSLTGVEAANYKVYYSDNINATRDLEDTSNGWTEEGTTNSKSFLIVFAEDYKMAEGTRIDFTYNITIPGNLEPSSAAYGMYKVYYNNESEIGSMPESKESAVIGIKTEAGPQLTADISANIDTVKEGQIVKMTATVKNTGEQTAHNVKVKIQKPQYAAFADFSVGSDFIVSNDENRTIEIGDIEAGKEAQVSYYVKIEDYTYIGYEEDMTEEEIAAVDEANKFPKSIVHSLEILTDDLKNPIKSNEYTMQINDGNISIALISDIADDRVLKNGDEVNFTIRALNITGDSTPENTIVSVELPNGMEYVSASIINLEGGENSTDGITFDEATRTLKVNLGKLEFYKEISLKTKVSEITGKMRMVAIATADNIEENYSNVFEHESDFVGIELSELTSKPRYVKEREDITYNIVIKNNAGSVATNVSIIDELPEGLELVKATYKYNGEDINATDVEKGKLNISLNYMNPGEFIELTIIAKADYLPSNNDLEVKNKIMVKADGMEQIESNEVTNIIEYNAEINHPGEGSDTPGQETGRYRITGTAWIDSNQDGKRDDGEEIVSGVQVYLLNQKQNSIVQDVDTNEPKITTTNSSGKYEFTNLEPGNYLVVFVYDSSRYSLTEYQAQDVDTAYNSDVIDINITLNGERRIAAITDTIQITDDNARDIDIGMYEAEKFDLRLDKYVSKITLSTPTIGTSVYEHNNLKVAQVEVLGQNLGRSTAAVEYTIVVTNEGSVAGYVRNIVDYIPEGFSFSTELNKDWYLSDNGNIYNASLENTKLEPGATQEIKLILSVNITEDKLGITSNTAEIYESYNEKGLQDIDSKEANGATNEDDMSKADVVLGLVTGKIITYTAIIVAVIAILIIGIYEIKKHVLKKKN